MSMRAQRRAVAATGPTNPSDGPPRPGLPDRRRFVRNLALGGAAVAAGAAAVPAAGRTGHGPDQHHGGRPPTIPAGDVTLVNFAIRPGAGLQRSSTAT